MNELEISCASTERGKLFERHVAVVDAAHLVDAVDKFHEVDGIARPLQEAAFFRVIRYNGEIN